MSLPTSFPYDRALRLLQCLYRDALDDGGGSAGHHHGHSGTQGGVVDDTKYHRLYDCLAPFLLLSDIALRSSRSSSHAVQNSDSHFTISPCTPSTSCSFSSSSSSTTSFYSTLETISYFLTRFHVSHVLSACLASPSSEVRALAIRLSALLLATAPGVLCLLSIPSSKCPAVLTLQHLLLDGADDDDDDDGCRRSKRSCTCSLSQTLSELQERSLLSNCLMKPMMESEVDQGEDAVVLDAILQAITHGSELNKKRVCNADSISLPEREVDESIVARDTDGDVGMICRDERKSCGGTDASVFLLIASREKYIEKVVSLMTHSSHHVCSSAVKAWSSLFTSSMLLRSRSMNIKMTFMPLWPPGWSSLFVEKLQSERQHAQSIFCHLNARYKTALSSAESATCCGCIEELLCIPLITFHFDMQRKGSSRHSVLRLSTTMSDNKSMKTHRNFENGCEEDNTCGLARPDMNTSYPARAAAWQFSLIHLVAFLLKDVSSHSAWIKKVAFKGAEQDSEEGSSCGAGMALLSYLCTCCLSWLAIPGDDKILTARLREVAGYMTAQGCELVIQKGLGANRSSTKASCCLSPEFFLQIDCTESKFEAVRQHIVGCVRRDGVVAGLQYIATALLDRSQVGRVREEGARLLSCSHSSLDTQHALQWHLDSLRWLLSEAERGVTSGGIEAVNRSAKGCAVDVSVCAQSALAIARVLAHHSSQVVRESAYASLNCLLDIILHCIGFDKGNEEMNCNGQSGSQYECNNIFLENEHTSPNSLRVFCDIIYHILCEHRLRRGREMQMCKQYYLKDNGEGRIRQLMRVMLRHMNGHSLLPPNAFQSCARVVVCALQLVDEMARPLREELQSLTLQELRLMSLSPLPDVRSIVYTSFSQLLELSSFRYYIKASNQWSALLCATGDADEEVRAAGLNLLSPLLHCGERDALLSSLLSVDDARKQDTVLETEKLLLLLHFSLRRGLCDDAEIVRFSAMKFLTSAMAQTTMRILSIVFAVTPFPPSSVFSHVRDDIVESTPSGKLMTPRDLLQLGDANVHRLFQHWKVAILQRAQLFISHALSDKYGSRREEGIDHGTRREEGIDHGTRREEGIDHVQFVLDVREFLLNMSRDGDVDVKGECCHVIRDMIFSSGLCCSRESGDCVCDKFEFIRPLRKSRTPLNQNELVKKHGSSMRSSCKSVFAQVWIDKGFLTALVVNVESDPDPSSRDLYLSLMRDIVNLVNMTKESVMASTAKELQHFTEVADRKLGRMLDEMESFDGEGFAMNFDFLDPIYPHSYANFASDLSRNASENEEEEEEMVMDCY